MAFKIPKVGQIIPDIIIDEEEDPILTSNNSLIF